MASINLGKVVGSDARINGQTAITLSGANGVSVITSGTDVTVDGNDIKTELTTHTSNTDIHVTREEKAGWDSKADLSDIPTTLPANGGNADTLNGLHANEIASNPNLIDNPDFRINQRGFVSGSTGTGGFCIDRWLIGAGETFTYNDDGSVTIKCVASGGRIFQQHISIPAYLIGKTVTLSTGIVDASGRISFGYTDDSGMHTDYITKTGIVSKSFEITSTSLDINLVPADVDSYITISYIKLEFGSIATPFCPPNPAEELLKIQSMTDDGTSKLISNSNMPTIMNSQMVSNPNLLINPDFKINQRGQSEYTGSTNYLFTVDCWRVGFGDKIAKTLTVEPDGVVFGSTTDRQYLVQIIENPERLIGDYTLTFCVSEITGSAVIQFVENDATSSSTVISEPGVYSVTRTLSGTGTAGAIRLQLRSEVGSTVKVRWAKLEPGSIATPFCPPDPATELAKCQRYYYSTYQGVPAGTADSYVNELVLNAMTSNRFNHTIIDFPTTMRTTPTVRFFDPATGEEGYASMTGTNEKVPVNVLIAGQNRAAIGSSVLTVGMDYYLHYTASAEL